MQGDCKDSGVPVTREHKFRLRTINLQTNFERPELK